MSRPVLTIVAGSNGCGKSTLTKGARDAFQQAPILDPDAIARSVRSSSPQGLSDLEAGKHVLRIAEELLSASQSFTVETTLSGNTYLRMAKEARSRGFLVRAILIGTTSIEINIARVKNRVLNGGHDVTEVDQRRRYSRTLFNMRKLLQLADLTVILDNSTAEGYSLVAAGRQGHLRWNEPIPEWADSLLMERVLTDHES